MMDYVAELKQNPNDWDTWLIYSDTLLRQGNPLGELIGLEHRLFFSPGHLEGNNYSALMEAREQARNDVEEDLKEKGVSRVLDWYHGLPRDVDFNGNNEQKAKLIRENPFIQLIETIRGGYKAFSKLVPGTRRHADELWQDRLVLHELREMGFYIADGAVYFLSKDGKSQHLGGEPYLALTREGSNPLLKNLGEAYKQLSETRDYRVPEEDLESALADPETEVFELSKLGLDRYYDDYSILEIPTRLISQSLNDDQRRLVERVYGKGDDFEKVRAMLTERSEVKIRVFVLN
ncbi:MAG: hypothetical protein Q8Q01_00395, partial [archaeon]|nr:hypothetical protein [archaeon]